MEQAYRKWICNKYKHRIAVFICLLIIYLVILIVKFNNQSYVWPLIISCISLSMQLTMLFFMRKNEHKAEIIITSNIVIVGFCCEIYRLFAHQADQWYLGCGLAIIKSSITMTIQVIYLHGNHFVFQTGVQTLSFSSSFYEMGVQDGYLITCHILVLVMLVCLRYQFEFTNRHYFIASQSQEQYENVVEDLLPSWVVILKYDKLQGQLAIEKINKNMREKLDIDCDRTFREFIRRLKVLPYDVERQSLQYIKLEHTLIRLLQMKSEDHEVERYHGFMNKKESKTKQWKFKITQVYFKSFEPSVILLFEELKEDKYEQLLMQIEQRDKTSFSNSKMSITIITQQLQLLKYIKHQIKNPQIQTHLSQQIQLGYFLFNLNYNILNLFKISHRQIKFEVNEISVNQLLEQFGHDLFLKQKASQKNLFSFNFVDVIKSDRAKVISILINLIEFIKILLSIMYVDEKILTQTVPLEKQIEITIKQSKTYQKCCKISLSHQKLNIPLQIQDMFGNIESSIDHKKRNWGSKNYFDMINQLNTTFQQIFEYYKRENKSTLILEEELLTFQHIIKSNVNYSQDSRLLSNPSPHYQFNTLGYPLAQYLVSQLGPCNKINFKQIRSSCSGTQKLIYTGKNQTAIQFLIYEDLNDFIAELNKVENPLMEAIAKRKYTGPDTSQKLYYQQLDPSPRRYF